jgi:hypothetical protein
MAGEHAHPLERTDFGTRESIHLVTKENKMIDCRQVLRALIAGSAPALGVGTDGFLPARAVAGPRRHGC